MSKAAISYKSLGDAESEAKATSKKLDSYADSLNSSVYKKLNKYDGEWSSNISTARTKVNQKINKLRSEADEYAKYADELKELKKECQSTDKAVRSKVSSLTGKFKKRHGIKNNPVVNQLNYLGTKWGNSTAGGRWLRDKKDEFEADCNDLKQRIEFWYDYEGGKELISGGIVAVLSIVIAVVGILTAGTVLALITAIIAGAIAIVGGLVNLSYEIGAYKSTRYENDPATGRRKSEINSAQDLLRRSDNKAAHVFANVLDITTIVCGVINLLSSIKDLIGKGYKWATDNTDDLAKINWKNVFTKDTFLQFKTKLADSFKAMKFSDWGQVKKFALDFGSDFIQNLKMKYANGGKILDSVKNTMSLVKDLFSKGLNIGVIMERIIMPGITIGQITTIDIPEGGGQISWDFGAITGKDIYDIGIDIYDICDNDLFKGSDKINISIPEIKVPEIDIQVDVQFDFQLA